MLHTRIVSIVYGWSFAFDLFRRCMINGRTDKCGHPIFPQVTLSVVEFVVIVKMRELLMGAIAVML